MKPVILIFFFGFFILMLPTRANALNCPEGSQHFLQETTPKLKSDPFLYYGIKEEFCGYYDTKGEIIRNGPYILWGPNGEKSQEGQYLNGKKEGKWIRRIPSQTLEDTWQDGKYITARILSNTPDNFYIDFEACNPHTYGIPAGLGSTSYTIIGKEGDVCKLTYSIEIEMGQGPVMHCKVPQKLGRLNFPNTDMGLNFSSIKEFCNEKE